MRSPDTDGSLMVIVMDRLDFWPTLNDGFASVTLSNDSGFTWSVDRDQALGKTEAVKRRTSMPEADGCTQVHSTSSDLYHS